MTSPQLLEIQQVLGIAGTAPAAHTGLQAHYHAGLPLHEVLSPADGTLLGKIQMADDTIYDRVVESAQQAFEVWREIPAPKRGEIVRQIGDALRRNKEALGKLVSLEMGKIYQEGLGEVQEMIDICDFAVGLSRQLYGLTMQSERKHHRMYEQWHPLGVVGVISAFNFPVAVWSWNAMLAAVCGNVVVWKPSEKTPLTSIACMHIVSEVLKVNHLPDGIFSVVVGGREIGERMAHDHRLPLISATGSTRMGRAVGEAVAKRMGKSLLELGGNNAIIVTRNANLKLAIPAIVFGAVGTCGQRCTSTRRLIVDEQIYDELKNSLLKAYASLPARIGHPLDSATLIGPLIDRQAVEMMQRALEQVQAEGGKLLTGGEVLSGDAYPTGTYVLPAIVEAENHYAAVQQETFAPILYLMKYKTLPEALDMHNGV
ncbi:MAG: aldehyde dehydrogenase family protein, partial [Bacteroidetes bacterium]